MRVDLIFYYFAKEANKVLRLFILLSHKFTQALFKSIVIIMTSIMTVDDRMNDVNMEMEMEMEIDGEDDTKECGETLEDSTKLEIEISDDESESKTEKKDVLDLNKLLALLDSSKEAAQLIADKHVVTLIGGTGVGKTTSTLYLAGARFEEVDVDGYTHYKVSKVPNDALSKFAVSGSGNSVTTTIQATQIPFVGANGHDEGITICDTPGFEDTKGVEMEISNGLGTIAAFRGATSVKPVIVMDHSTMKANRFSPLRKNLSTVIAMMGSNPDFSSFSYIFTHCDTKTKKKISKQLTGFLNAVLQDPNIENKEILVKLLTHMISKTAPNDVICIDPEEPDDASDTLKKLLSGPRIEDPANSFINFCSKEAMAALLLQLNIELSKLESSLASDLDSTEEHLRKLSCLANALSLPVVNKMVEQGVSKVKAFLNQLSNNIKHSMERIDKEFEDSLAWLVPKLQLISTSTGIHHACGITDFDSSTFIRDIAEKLFSFVRTSISSLGPSLIGKERILQQAIIHYVSLDTSLQGLLNTHDIKIEYDKVILAVTSVLNPLLKELDDSLRQRDPTSIILSACLPKLDSAIQIRDLISSIESRGSNFQSLELSWFGNGVNNILMNINEQSNSCITNLEDLDKSLQEELLQENEWSHASISKLDESETNKECRDFIKIMSSSTALVSICEESSTDFETLIDDFDANIKEYTQGIVSFLQYQEHDIIENEKGDTSSRAEDAKTVVDSTDNLISIIDRFCALNGSFFKNISDELIGAKNRLLQYIKIEEKTIARRGKLTEPTKAELARAGNKKLIGNLRRWYEQYNELKEYWKKQKHCNVPRKDPKLGIWVNEQRKAMVKYKAGKKTPMTDEKVRHLADIDFQWSVKKEREEDLWNERYEELVIFKEGNDHCKVPQTSGKLGRWVHNQRQRRATTSKEKFNKLKDIGLYD